MWDKEKDRSIIPEPPVFFFNILRTRDPETIQQFIQALEKGTEALIDHAINISYYMRGSQQYEAVFDLIYLERMRMMNFINKRLEFEFEKYKKGGKLNAVY